MQAADRRVEKKTKHEPWRDPHADAYVRIENVTKRFGDFVAVNNVSLKIYKGEIFCLLGGSGCGKSTLLRMLAGFEAPTSGSIFIDDLMKNVKVAEECGLHAVLFRHPYNAKEAHHLCAGDWSETVDLIRRLVPRPTSIPTAA